MFKSSRLLLVAFWFLSTASIVKGESVLIEDFAANPESRWGYFADTVMGGVSQGKVEFLSESQTSFLRLSGEVSTANNGGFIQVRASFSGALNEEVEGLKLQVRGNGEPYYIHIRTSGTRVPWQYYQMQFPTTSEWAEVTLPFSSFKPSGSFMRKTMDPTKIRTLGIVAYGRNFEADLDVSRVYLY